MRGLFFCRCYVSVSVLEGAIYAMGGFDGHVRQNTAERYTPKNNQWSLIAPMNMQRSDASATSLAGRKLKTSRPYYEIVSIFFKFSFIPLFSSPFTLRVALESIICYSHIFENNLEIKRKLTTCLKRVAV